MKTPVQDLIVNFISQNPGAQMGDVIKALPELARSSISSTLPVLVRQGRLLRTTGRLRRYEYRVCQGKPIKLVPEKVETNAVKPITPNLVPKDQVISQEEWQRRFEMVQELANKGFPRRAARLSLELLDVTGDARLREQLIIFKAGTNRVGVWL